jgi:hypothetical protein
MVAKLPLIGCAVATIFTFLFTVALILVITLSYIPAQNEYHTAKCNILNCTAELRYCGTYSGRYSAGIIMCVDVTETLELLNTNLTNIVSYTNEIYTSTIDGLFGNSSLQCSKVIENWNSVMKCYYHDNNLPNSLTTQRDDSIGIGPLVGIILLSFACGISLLVTLVVFTYAFCSSINDISINRM